MATSTAFLPKTTTLTISASTTSADESWPTPGSDGDCLRVFNATDGIAFIAIGRGAQTATTANIPIAPNSVEVIGCSDGSDTVAVILSAGTGSVYVTKGEGI